MMQFVSMCLHIFVQPKVSQSQCEQKGVWRQCNTVQARLPASALTRNPVTRSAFKPPLLHSRVDVDVVCGICPHPPTPTPAELKHMWLSLRRIKTRIFIEFLDTVVKVAAVSNAYDRLSFSVKEKKKKKVLRRYLFIQRALDRNILFGWRH